MAIALDQIFVDGDVYDVLVDCDQLSLALARLHRQKRMSEQEWRSSADHLAAIRVRIEAHLTAWPEGEEACMRLEAGNHAGARGAKEGPAASHEATAQLSTGGASKADSEAEDTAGRDMPLVPLSVGITGRRRFGRALMYARRALWAVMAEEQALTWTPRIRWP